MNIKSNQIARQPTQRCELDIADKMSDHCILCSDRGYKYMRCIHVDRQR